LLIELFAEIAEERMSAYELMKRYGISLLEVRVLRQFPMWAVEYVIAQTKKRKAVPGVRGHILRFQRRTA
jgi:hypothetical protein